MLSNSGHKNTPRILVWLFPIVPSGEHRATQVLLVSFWDTARGEPEVMAAGRKGLKVISPLDAGSSAQVLNQVRHRTQNLSFPRAREILTQTAQGEEGSPSLEVLKTPGSVALVGLAVSEKFGLKVLRGLFEP